jgi:hypothetical protein
MIDARGTRWADWLKQPASLLSLTAAIISVSTFVLVYANPGRLEVYLPDEVAVGLNRGRDRLLIPLSLTNTGAARTHRQIIRITAQIIPDVGDASSVTIPFSWAYEVQLMHAEQFRLKYGPKAPVDTGLVDVVDYVNRALALHMPGSSSQLRTYEFVQSDTTPVLTVPSTFELRLNVVTVRGTVSVAARYHGCGRLSANYCWCERIL